MRLALQYVLSLVFIAQMYLAMAVFALIYLPAALIGREGAFRAIHGYARWVRLSASFLVGLKSEIRGEVPQDEVVIASKHQSFFDIIMICSVVPRPKFIMKKELLWAPILGWYATRIGCIPVDRGKRSKAMTKMVEDARNTKIPGGQLIIFPQGTRVAAGARLQYKIGVGVLYSELKQDCVPAATNVGVFWPRHGLLRKPGVAVVEFLPRIEAGRSIGTFMRELEPAIENASDRLMRDAGFDLPPTEV